MTLDSRDRTLFRNDKISQYREKNNIHKRAYHAHNKINDIFHLGLTDFAQRL